MRVITLPIAVFLFFVFSAGATMGQVVTIPLYAEQGDSLDISYTLERVKNGQSNIGEIKAKISIISTSDESFVASWTTQSVTANGRQIDALSPQAASILIGVPIEYLAAWDGSPIQVKDKSQILESLLNLGLMVSDTSDRLMRFYNSMSDDAFAQVLLKVPNIMSVCQYMELPLGEPALYEGQSANPFAGEPFRNDISYLLEDVDEAKQEARIIYKSSFNAEDSMQAAKAAIKQLASDATSMEKEIDTLEIARNDTVDCIIDMQSGWIKSMTSESEMTGSGEKQLEKYSLTVDYHFAEID